MPNSFYSQLRNLIDPGMVSGYYPQTFPGHPAAQEFDWREAAPPGAGLIGLPMAGAFGGYRLNTSVAWRPGNHIVLKVDNVELDSPTEGIKALRDLYDRATRARASSIWGYPLIDNEALGSKRSMKSMVGKLGPRLGQRIVEKNYGDTWEISVEKLGEFLRRNPNR